MGDCGHAGCRAQPDAEQWSEHAEHRTEDGDQDQNDGSRCQRQREGQALVDSPIDVVVGDGAAGVADRRAGRQTDALDDAGGVTMTILSGTGDRAIPGQGQHERLAISARNWWTDFDQHV